MASLVAKVCVPDDFNHRVVQKVVLTDRYLVAGAFDGWITVLDVREAQQAEETDPIQYQRTLAADMWWDLDCRDDLIATANDNGNVTLWEAQTGTRRLDLVGHTGSVRVLLLPANQNIVVSGSRDTNIIIWDADSGRRRFTLMGHPKRIKGLKVFDNLLVSSCAKGLVKVWDLNTGSCLQSIQTPSTAVVDVALNYNHTLLAAGFREGWVTIWDIEKGNAVLNAFAGNTHVTFELSNQPENVLSSSSADGTTRSWSWTSGDLLAMVDHHDIVPDCGVVWVESVMTKAINRWDSEALIFWSQLHNRGYNVVRVAKRGNIVAIAAFFHNKSSTIELWDLTELEERKKRRRRGRNLPL